MSARAFLSMSYLSRYSFTHTRLRIMFKRCIPRAHSPAASRAQNEHDQVHTRTHTHTCRHDHENSTSKMLFASTPFCGKYVCASAPAVAACHVAVRWQRAAPTMSGRQRWTTSSRVHGNLARNNTRKYTRAHAQCELCALGVEMRRCGGTHLWIANAGTPPGSKTAASVEWSRFR